MDPIIIVGSGLAGYNLARDIHKLDPNVELVIITQDNGDYYSKPMLSNSLTQGKTPDKLHIFNLEAMRDKLQAKIIINTTVTKIDPQNKLISYDNTELKYSKLVLALGATAKHAVIPNNCPAKIISVNNLADYTKFRELLDGCDKVAILGSGLIGCEFANDLLNADINVDIISLAEYPLDTIAIPAAGNSLQQALAAAGASWHLQTKINNVSLQDNLLDITLANGETIQAGLLLSAIGLAPQTDLAKNAKLAVNRGIVVNEYLQTSNPDIYALGDCAEVCGYVLQFITPISHATQALAKTLTEANTKIHYPAMPASVKTPACPMVSFMPPKDIEGDWDTQQEGNNVRALFYDTDNNLRGYVLTGNYTKHRMELTKLLPDLI